jgi:hypothetical protein
VETGDGWNTYDTPLAVWIFVRKVEWDGEDVDVGKRFREPSTPVFDVSPVCRGASTRGVDDSQGHVKRTMTVESYTDLRCDVGQQERLVHRFLRDLCVCSGCPTQRRRHPVHERARTKRRTCVPDRIRS